MHLENLRPLATLWQPIIYPFFPLTSVFQLHILSVSISSLHLFDQPNAGLTSNLCIYIVFILSLSLLFEIKTTECGRLGGFMCV